MLSIAKRFVSDTSGATAMEYSLVAVLISLAIIVGATAVGNNVAIKFNDIANKVK